MNEKSLILLISVLLTKKIKNNKAMRGARQSIFLNPKFNKDTQFKQYQYQKETKTNMTSLCEYCDILKN